MSTWVNFTRMNKKQRRLFRKIKIRWNVEIFLLIKIEFRIIVLIFSTAPAWKKKWQIFKIQHVQIDVLPRTLDLLLRLKSADFSERKKNLKKISFINGTPCSGRALVFNLRQFYVFFCIFGLCWPLKSLPCCATFVFFSHSLWWRGHWWCFIIRC